MPLQGLRGGKSSLLHPAGSGVTHGVNDFHVVRVQEERIHLVKDMGASEARNQVDQSFFVPSLRSLCADVLAQNFVTMPEIDDLRTEISELYDMVIERLPPALLPQEEEAEARRKAQEKRAAAEAALFKSAVVPSLSSSPSAADIPTSVSLSVAVPRVVSESYWKRCCLTRWSSGQLSKFVGGDESVISKEYGWKRLLLEHVLADFLMSLRDDSGDAAPPAAGGDGAVAGAGVGAMGGNPKGHTRAMGGVPLAALLFDGDGVNGEFEPPQISAASAQAVAALCALCRDYTRTIELPCQYVRLDWFEHVFSHLPGVLNFRLTYGARTAGVGYHKRMLTFTDVDAEHIRFLLTKYTTMETLRLPQNSITSPQALMISSALVGNTRLRVLDLSRNAIDDAAIVEGIALLLCQSEFLLEELNLSDNNITDAGATALADALLVNHTLLVLNLSQNRIGDAEGGAKIFRALADHSSSPLQELNLGNNLLAEETVAALRVTLPVLSSLASLTLSGNRRIGISDRKAARTGSSSGDPALTLRETPVGDSRPESTMAESAPSTGDMLCQAVMSSTSLHFIDVRFCGLTTEQVCTIEGHVQGRVERMRAEERAAKEDEQRRRIAAAVASRPSGRW